MDASSNPIGKDIAACIHCARHFAMSPYKIKKHYRVCDDCVRNNRAIRKSAVPAVQGNYQPIAVAQTRTVPTAKPTAVKTSEVLGEQFDGEEIETHERKVATQPKVVCDEGFNSKYVPQNGEVEKLEMAIRCGKNVLLTGPTGCGKTHLVYALAKKLGKPVYSPPNGGGTYERIVAKETLVESNGNTVTKRQDGLLPMAMKDEAGAIFYCDEPNSYPDEVLFCLFSAMDDRRSISFDDGTTVDANKGFTVIGAMNEGAGYGGTHILNAAFRSRTHRIIDMEYLPQEREAKMLVARTGVDSAIADKLTKCAKALRASLAAKTLKTPIGTRDLLACATFIANGDNVHSAIQDTIINRAPSTSPERQSISDVVAAYFGKEAK